jgi:hypothetical protein
MADTVVGVFDDWEEARAAIERLRDASFPTDQVSVLAADRKRAATLETETLDREQEGMVLGAAAGGALGAAGGWALGLATFAIPGIGPIIAAGPILAAIAGLAAGAGAGGLIGATLGSGIPEEEVAHYEGALNRGGILVAVAAPGREEEARGIMETSGAVQTERRDVDDEDARRDELAPTAVAGMAAASPGGLANARDVPLDVPGAHAAGVLPTTGYSGVGTVSGQAAGRGAASGTTGAFETTERAGEAGSHSTADAGGAADTGTAGQAVPSVTPGPGIPGVPPNATASDPELEEEARSRHVGIP